MKNGFEAKKNINDMRSNCVKNSIQVKCYQR